MYIPIEWLYNAYIKWRLAMTVYDNLIIFGPLLVLVFGMLIAFGIYHYLDVREL
jgi:hypothetical protein